MDRMEKMMEKLLDMLTKQQDASSSQHCLSSVGSEASRDIEDDALRMEMILTMMMTTFLMSRNMC